MDNIIFIIITTIVLAAVLIFITRMIVRRNSTKAYKNKVTELDIEKNKLINVKILSEITKVRTLVKTDNLQHKLNDWDNTFNNIKDKMLPELTDEISEVDFMVDKYDFKGAIRKMATIEMKIEKLRRQSQKLIEEIQIITNSEERNRALITKLKVEYRELQSKFNNNEKEYGKLDNLINKEFKKIDEIFIKFENAMDNNDYVEVEKIIEEIEEKLNWLRDILDNVPPILLMATVLVPGKMEETKLQYSRMIRDGYTLDYLKVDYNLEEIRKKVDNILENIYNLNLESADVELKIILEYFNSLFGDFEKEKECKDLYKEGSKKFRHKLEKVNKVVYDIYIQIDDIKVTYDLTDEEINRFSVLNKNLEEINVNYKKLLTDGKNKALAYTKLYDDLESLEIKLSRLQDDLDYQLKSITSMKDDEYRAKEQLNTIQDLLKKSKLKLKDYKLPVIPSNYYVELKEAQDAIKEIVKELDKKPIVIKILNIRVDTARDLVFKIYNKTNDMIKVSNLSERMIIYGNRYRSTYKEIEQGLEKATTLFYKGQYEDSLKTSIEAIKLIESDPLTKIK